MSQQTTIETILDYPLIPIFYNSNSQIALGVFDACYKAGMRIFEFTNRGADAFETFKLLQQNLSEFPNYIIGAGTVFKERDAEAFIEAGASFIVSPCFIESVADICYQNKIPYLPGCMTVKEVFYASEAGCEVIKVFPGEVLGTDFVKAVKSVLPDVKLMVTDSVSPNRESITSWFKAGASAVGLSSELFKSEWIEREDYKAIQEAVEHCFRYLQ